jgi:hypothetical protein
LAIKYKDEFEAAAEELEDSTYVDDWLSSFEETEDAIKVTIQMIELLIKGGFPLMKFSSNCEKLMNTIPQDHKCAAFQDLPTVKPMIDTLEGESWLMKTLGVKYDMKQDSFFYDLNAHVKSWKKENLTKRIVLSYLASIYDPLGLISPYIAHLKVLNQECWRHDLKWDDKIPPDIEKRWNKEVELLQLLPVLEFPRHLHLDKKQQSKLELITCCDASQLLYAACIYLRVTKADGVYCNLLACKSRVVPIKGTMTIPRLELTACLLGARLAQYVLKTLRLTKEECKMRFYTDSAISCYWIKQPKSKTLQYVTNRVEEINHLTKREEWSHVRTFDNAADWPTRPTSYKLDNFQNLWAKGKEWISSGKEPEKGDFDDTEMMTLANQETPKYYKTAIDAMVIEKRENDLMEQLTTPRVAVSSHHRWAKTVRIVAYIKRVSKHNYSSTTIKREEYLQAEIQLLQFMQANDFQAEITALQENKSIELSSKIKHLRPLLKKDGLLHADSRIALDTDEQIGAEANYTEPIILAPEGPLVEALIFQYHKQAMHGKTERTLAEISQHFWILRSRQVIKKTIKHCY